MKIFDKDPHFCVLWGLVNNKNFLFLQTYFFPHSMVRDDNLLLSKLLYLHNIYYNVIGQDPNHEILY
jgi:hypothetical protein